MKIHSLAQPKFEREFFPLQSRSPFSVCLLLVLGQDGMESNISHCPSTPPPNRDSLLESPGAGSEAVAEKNQQGHRELRMVSLVLTGVFHFIPLALASLLFHQGGRVLRGCQRRRRFGFRLRILWCARALHQLVPGWPRHQGL